MLSKSNIFILTFVCIFFIQINGQGDDCRPGMVRNVQLSSKSILSWDPPLTENCDIEHYLVSVSLFGSTEEVFSYTVTDKSIDLGHLTECVRYSFKVTQVSSANVTGPTATIHIVTPPPSEADLALNHVNVTTVGRNIQLVWGLNEQWVPCAQRYRVVVYNELSNTASDIYTPATFVTVTGLIPCASYTFTVTAIFTLEEEGPATVAVQVAPDVAVSFPVLQNITLGTTNADLILNLPTVQQNKCPIYSVSLTGSINATNSITNQYNRTPFPINLTGLKPDRLYYLKIFANNTAGLSRPLHFAFQTLPSN